MRQISKSTETFPLMLNFSKAKPMEIVNAEDIAMVYDPVKQVTLYMGGGSSKGSRSQTSTKKTVRGIRFNDHFEEKLYRDDHEYGSDD